MGEVITIGLDIAKSVFQITAWTLMGGGDPQARQPSEGFGVLLGAAALPGWH